MRCRLLAVPAFALGVYLVALAPDTAPVAAQQKKGAADDALAAVKLADANLKVAVWAAEPLMANPVSFCFDEKGRAFVAETTRFDRGVPDTRGHMQWLDEDLANRTTDDLLAMYKKHKYTGFEKYDDQVRLVWDSTGAGKADKSEVFASGFNRPQDGLAAGLLARRGNVYLACIPDLYLLKDTKGENKADVKQSLFTGFGPTVQYLGHDLHGLRMGPDGKLYFSMGDRGFNVTTKEGKKLQYPNTGAVLRCDPDGKNLEVVHHGLRNPQEIAFDDYGNLFTYDNNSDSGDRARWVHIVEGGDSGWRGGFQYGTLYHPPGVPQGNRGPWNTEKLWLPQHEGQPAYIVPPLLNFGNGPAGITHYPGVGLNEKYRDHFFACDFTSNSGSSVIWSLSVKPKGASFEVVPPKEFVKGMVPTDCEFGPDGAFYWSDWVGGWNPPGRGRIFRVTDPEAMKNPAVAEAKKLLAEGIHKKDAAELEELLHHPHQQVRTEAHIAMAERTLDSTLRRVLRDSKNQLARLHAIWGTGLYERLHPEKGSGWVLLAVLDDPDPVIRANAVKTIGTMPTPKKEDEEVTQRWAKVAKLLTDKDNRVKAEAAITYGKMGPPAIIARTPGAEQSFYAPLFDMLKANDDKDPYLRHAAVMGLVHAARNPLDLFNAWTLAKEQAKDKYDVPAVRMGVLLALRKHRHGKVAEFLRDSDPRIVEEAARAMYDELGGQDDPLAALAEKPGLSDAVAYRALAANYLRGTDTYANRLAFYAAQESEPDHRRVFALKLLGDWETIPRRDPITGLSLKLPVRDKGWAVNALKRAGVKVFSGSAAVRTEAARVAAKLDIKEFGPAMAAIVKDATQPVGLRVEALFAVDALKDAGIRELVAFVLASKEPKLRAAGLVVWAKTDTAILKQFPTMLKDEKLNTVEKQAIFAALAQAGASPDVDKALDEWLDSALAKKVAQEIVLDILDAAETRAATPKLKLFAPLKSKVDKYRGEAGKQADKLAPFLESLAGGDADRGRAIFLNNSAVYCQRCHKLDNQGGDVGPQLNGIAAEKDKDRRYLLESIALPNAKIAKNYETVILVLEDERTVSGIIRGEDKTNIKIMTAENKEIVIPVKDIAARRTGPSAMPDDLHKKMTRRELRDVVEFLTSLKEPPKK